MTENPSERAPREDPINPHGADWEEAGLPAQEDETEDQPLPEERPVAMEEFGTTGTEKEAGEPLDVSLAREEPDVTQRDTITGGATDEREHVREEGTPQPRERLVEQDEGVRADEEKDLVAEDTGAERGAFTAEEDAVRIEPEEGATG